MKHQKAVGRAVGIATVDTVRADARKSKKNLRQERSQRDRCKCGRKASLTRASVIEGTQHFCSRCLADQRKEESK